MANQSHASKRRRSASTPRSSDEDAPCGTNLLASTGGLDWKTAEVASAILWVAHGMGGFLGKITRREAVASVDEASTLKEFRAEFKKIWDSPEDDPVKTVCAQ
jgi:hypothetical protein